MRAGKKGREVAKNIWLLWRPCGKIICKTNAFDFEEKEVISVYTVGKLDKNIYKCITDDIATDEVIITDERIMHIKERHPDDYERYSQYIGEMVAVPQYILHDPVPKTAVILQEFFDGTEHFRLVMKIAVIGEKGHKNNSVITFMKISEKKYNKYLRNKKVLYKRE